MTSVRKRILVMLALILAITSACGGAATPPPPTETPEQPAPTPTDNVTQTAAGPQEHDALTPVTLAMGFVPNVQFASFYVAQSKGYFAEEGIDLQFDYGMENDLVQLVAADELKFAVASGDQVILGRSAGLPVRYVMQWYSRFPVAVTSLDLELDDPKALEGQTVGLPGLFGANYVGWLALAYASDLDKDAVNLESVGFNQVATLTEGQIDAAVVYATNEPLQLRDQGYDPSTIYVADYIDLVANGIITNETTIEEQPELVAGMVRASLRGLSDAIDNPDDAFDIVVEEYVPEAGGDNEELQRAILNETLKFWRAEDQLGVSDPAAWETSVEFMEAAEMVDDAPPIDSLYTNDFVEQAGVND